MELIDLHSIFKDNLVISSIPNYFNKSETPIICYRYNKPIRFSIFNFNKIKTDIDIDSNTPDSHDCQNSNYEGWSRNTRKSAIISTILMRITLFLYTIKQNLCQFNIWYLNILKFNDVVLNDVMATSDRATRRTSMKHLFYHC